MWKKVQYWKRWKTDDDDAVENKTTTIKRINKIEEKTRQKYTYIYRLCVECAMGGFVFISVLLLLLFECEFSCYIHMSLKCNWNEREKCVEHIKSVEIIFHLSEPPVLISLSFSVFSIFVFCVYFGILLTL